MKRNVPIPRILEFQTVSHHQYNTRFRPTSHNENYKNNTKKWISVVKQYSEPAELIAELLNNMVEKIIIHEVIKYDVSFCEQKKFFETIISLMLKKTGLGL